METTKTIKQLIANSVEIGDNFQKKAVEKMDIGCAKVANQAYTNAVRALSAQVIYKKLTGSPGTIEFLED